MTKAVSIFMGVVAAALLIACDGSREQGMFYTSWVQQGEPTGFFDGKGVRVLIPNEFSGEIVFSVSSKARPLPSKNGVILVDVRKSKEVRVTSLNVFQENGPGKPRGWFGFDVVTANGNHLPLVEEAEVGRGYEQYEPADGTLHLFVGTRKQYRDRVVPKIGATPKAGLLQ